ncbi:MAG: nucleotidyltransferase domain-containing protein [Candidatus Woesearchaeota archaeon]
MVKEYDREVIDFKESILKKYPDAKIIMFGSRARGTNLKSSDFDFVVLSDFFENKKTPKRLEEVYLFWDSKFNADILPYTFEEFEEQSKLFTIARKAKLEGIFI